MPDKTNVTPDRVGRFLAPRMVAVVGASEKQPRSNNAILPMLAREGIEVALVNPNRPDAYGQKTFPNLEAIGRPVDAVLALVNADVAVSVAEEAAATEAGGITIVAGGFAESGPDGVAREERLQALAADGLLICGPNCTGFINVTTGARMSGAPPLPLRAGGIGVVTQSGALLSALAYSGRERELGFSAMISCGNETSLGVEDYLDYLIEDPATDAICLVLETLRRPEPFLAAARRAQEAGKPVVAVKLGRTERSREIARSHTGALVGESWVYEAVLRQHGVQLARDLTELLDRVICFEHLPRRRWTPVRGLAALSGSGGGAALLSDVFAEDGLDFPALEELRERFAELIPGSQTPNPLDFTGFVIGRPDVMSQLVDTFASSNEVDTMLMQVSHVEEMEGFAGTLNEAFEERATASGRAVVMASPDDGRIGPLAAGMVEHGTAVVRGTTAAARALSSMAQFVRGQEAGVGAPAPVEAVAGPDAGPIDSEVGPILPFDAAMDLLAGIGVATAPYLLLAPAEDAAGACPDFGGPYVAKLADVPHRTELGAVEARLEADQLPAAVDRLRRIAAERGCPADVVIQQMVEGDGEAFIGIDGAGELGPMVFCGLGGVLVEAMERMGVRRAPLSPADVDALLEGLGRVGVFEGLRGSRPWDRAELERLLVRAGSLAAGSAAWLASLDVNPLIHGPDGFVAVDALAVVR